MTARNVGGYFDGHGRLDCEGQCLQSRVKKKSDSGGYAGSIIQNWANKQIVFVGKMRESRPIYLSGGFYFLRRCFGFGEYLEFGQFVGH